MRTSVVTPYAAYLRVYEPLEAFLPAQRERWRAYADSGEARDRAEGARLEQRRALANLVALPPVPVPEREADEAYVLRVDGEPYVCPWQTRLRSWQSLADARRELPGPLLDLFLPPEVVDRAEEEYERWRVEHPHVTPHIRTSTWHVPASWFVLFGEAERRLHLDAQARALVYRTPMVEARRRTARALHVLRRTLEEGGPLVEGVESLGRWLEEFHPRSQVELDYGGLVDLIADDELAEDHSAADVTEGLTALARSDAEAAARAYARLMERWRPVQALEHAN